MSWPEWIAFTDVRHPWVLLLALPVLLLCIWEWTGRAPGVMAISTGETLAAVSEGRRRLMQRMPALLRALGLILLVFALARPMHGLTLRTDRANVIDIMLCVDVSGSMKAMDFIAGGQRQTRLAVVKETVREFIRARKANRADRFGIDRMGLILYAGFAWTQAPLTLDYAILEREIDMAEIDEFDPRKQGTAIGSALGLAVSKLRNSEAESKVIILLTDGLNNRGELDPFTAAYLAQEYGIRVYTIGAGSQGEVLLPQRTPFGEVMRQFHLPIDESSLRRIAEITGGRYFGATDTESLRQAYAEIDRLETTEIDATDYYEQHDAFPPFAAMGGVALLASILSRRQWFDPIP